MKVSLEENERDETVLIAAESVNVLGSGCDFRIDPARHGGRGQQTPHSD
jgi:hypothetical protein